MITLDSDLKIANMSTILLIILILLLIGALPTWAYSANRGVLPERGTRLSFAYSGDTIPHRTAFINVG